MSKLLKVREVITLKGWVDGSGWSYNQVYSDKIIEITDVPTAEEYDWSWYETPEDNPEDRGGDTLIVVDLYDVDADISDEPLAHFEKWASEIWKERVEK